MPSGPSAVPSARTGVVSMFTVLEGSCSVALEAAVLSNMLAVVVVEAVVLWASFCPTVVFVYSIFLPGGMAVFVTMDAYVVLVGLVSPSRLPGARGRPGANVLRRHNLNRWPVVIRTISALYIQLFSDVRAGVGSNASQPDAPYLT